LRIVGQEQAIDEIEAIVSTMIADCATQLQQEKTRLEKLKADNGITETPTYTHPTEFVAKIASPQIAQFVELIRLLDQLMIVMDTLWLCQVIDNKHCVEARYHWQQRLQRQAHRAAYAQGHGEEVRLAREESGLQAEPEDMADLENGGDVITMEKTQ
jgi:translation elongation factor EF-Ts